MTIKERISKTAKQLGLAGLLLVNTLPGFAQEVKAGSNYQSADYDIQSQHQTTQSFQPASRIKQEVAEELKNNFYWINFPDIEIREIYDNQLEGNPKKGLEIIFPEFDTDEKIKRNLTNLPEAASPHTSLYTFYFKDKIEEQLKKFYRIATSGRGNKSPKGLERYSTLLEKEFGEEISKDKLTEEEFVKRELQIGNERYYQEVVNEEQRHEKDWAKEELVDQEDSESKAMLIGLINPGKEYLELAYMLNKASLLNTPTYEQLDPNQIGCVNAASTIKSYFDSKLSSKKYESLSREELRTLATQIAEDNPKLLKD